MIALFCYSALSSAIVMSKAVGLLEVSWWWAFVPVAAPSIAVLVVYGPQRFARRYRLGVIRHRVAPTDPRD